MVKNCIVHYEYEICSASYFSSLSFMAIFGLVWVASWLSCFFSSSQNLLGIPIHPSKVIPARILATATTVRNPLFRLSIPASLGSHWSFYRPTLALVPVLSQSGRFPLQPRPSRSLVPTLAFLDTAGTFLLSADSIQSNRLAKIPPLSTANPQAEVGADLGLSSANARNLLRSLQNLLLGLPSVEVRLAGDSNLVLRAYYGSGKLVRYPQKPLQQTASSFSKIPDHATGFEVWVKGQLVAKLPKQTQAERFAQQIETLLQDPNHKISRIQPVLVKGVPAVKLSDRASFVIQPEIADYLGQNSEVLAIEWVNQLRNALEAPELPLAEAQVKMYSLQETGDKVEGLASWYGPYFHGRVTATGETFNQNELTAAHPSLPFNTFLKVTNLNNGKTIVVRINDRGPYIDDRTLDLSREAARRLDSEEDGVVPIAAVVMQSKIEKYQAWSPKRPDS